jgi:hypothetical protein
MTENYEQLRNSTKGAAGETWREADQLQGRLTRRYQELESEERLTSEYKSEQAWNAYSEMKDEILDLRKRARQDLLKSAVLAERESIPFPVDRDRGWSTHITDTQEPLAAQGEARRIVAKTERVGRREGPFKTSPVDVLRDEYRRVMSLDGGVQAATIVRGLYDAADELGVGVDDIADEHRRAMHRERLEWAADYRFRAESIPTSEQSVPRPPFEASAAEKFAMAGMGRSRAADEQARR